MSENTSDTQPTGSVLLWIGRGISLLIVLMFTMSGVMKFLGGEQLEEGMTHLGLPMSMVIPLAILELTCVVIYAVPMTSILGAVLLTGYLGGAICTHWRVGDPVYVQALLGIAVWLGLYFREPRLRSLLPLRSNTRSSKR